MTTDPFGIQERDATNNHGTCWVMQAAAFAHLTGNTPVQQSCRDRFKTVLVPSHMAADGSFPRQLARTKPYGYSLFNLDAMATIAEILSTPEDNLWTFELPDGRGIRRAMEFMVPFIRNKKAWPKPPDVMYDRGVADAAAEPPLCRHRVDATRLSRTVVHPASRLRRRRGRPQLLHPPTIAVDRSRPAL